MEQQYKSPVTKSNIFFQKSRDKWKIRAKAAIQKIRVYKKRIIFLETSKADLQAIVSELKARNIALEKQLDDVKKNTQC